MGLIFESFLDELLLLAVAGVTYVIWRGYRGAGVFDRAGIKRDTLWFNVILNCRLLGKKIPFVDYIDEVYKSLPKEKAIGFYQFITPVVLVRDIDLARRVLITDFAYFHDHSIEIDTTVNPLEGHLFNMSGGQWKALRNRLSPVFTSGRLRNMLPLVSEKADKLVGVLPRGEEMLIRDYLSGYAMDVIGSTAFGIEAGALDNPDCDFKKMANRIFTPTKKVIFKALFRLFLPKVAIAIKLRSLDREVEDFFFSVTKQGFEHRSATGQRRGDFIDLLLQLRGRGRLEVEGSGERREDGTEGPLPDLILTDELLTAQSFIFLLAGWETTTTAMMYAVYFLAKYQEVQERLRSSLQGLSLVDYDSLKGADYLDACIKESMRIYSPAAALIRVCTKDYIFDGGKRIDKGTVVVVPTQSFQRDPDNFPEPMEFKPERFLGDVRTPPGAYAPFGDGPRVCIAQRFANMEVRMAVGRLVQNFKITLGSKTREPLQLDLNTFVNNVKGGLWIVLEDLK